MFFPHTLGKRNLFIFFNKSSRWRTFIIPSNGANRKFQAELDDTFCVVATGRCMWFDFASFKVNQLFLFHEIQLRDSVCASVAVATCHP